MELLHRPGSGPGLRAANPAEAALTEGFGHLAFGVAGSGRGPRPAARPRRPGGDGAAALPRARGADVVPGRPRGQSDRARGPRMNPCPARRCTRRRPRTSSIAARRPGRGASAAIAAAGPGAGSWRRTPAGLHDLDGWLRSLGGTVAPSEPTPGAGSPPRSRPGHLSRPAGISGTALSREPGRPGEALWDLLDAAVRARGIEVRYETSAARLEIDPEGSVTGPRITHASGESTLTARGGVVLACGGFEADPALADAYSRSARPGRSGTWGTPAPDCGWRSRRGRRSGTCTAASAGSRSGALSTAHRSPSTSPPPRTCSPTPTAAGSPTRRATRCMTGSGPCCPTCPATPTGHTCPAGRCSTRRPGRLAR